MFCLNHVKLSCWPVEEHLGVDVNLQIGDGLDHVESRVYFTFCICYASNEAESSVYGDLEISMVVDHF